MSSRLYHFTSSSHSPTLPRDILDEKRNVGGMSRHSATLRTRSLGKGRAAPSTTTTVDLTETARNIHTRPVAVPLQPPSPERAQWVASHKRSMRRTTHTNQRGGSIHDPDALPPAVAALLAITTIPRPKSNQFRRRSNVQRRISVDELVSDWKAEELRGSLGSNSVLDLLLEDDDGDDDQDQGTSSFGEDDYLQFRSASDDSVPSLECDDKSILSLGSLPTPESLRSRQSYYTLRGVKKIRHSPVPETCPFEHPLADDPCEDDSHFIGTTANSKTTTTRKRSTFKSNLTASLQALKNAAISIASLNITNSSAPRSSPGPFADDLLWSQPYLVPQLSSEFRPADSSSAQRRHLNSTPTVSDSLPPLIFEDQEAPFQLALHAPYLAEQPDDLPAIPMQTYSSSGPHGATGKKIALARKGRHPDPTSEAGRAAAMSNSGNDGSGGAGSLGRQREPRENPDFLRVIVLEMNMRRKGKLEGGRARLCLPPRAPTMGSGDDSRAIPSRWVGISAYG